MSKIPLTLLQMSHCNVFQLRWQGHGLVWVSAGKAATLEVADLLRIRYGPMHGIELGEVIGRGSSGKVYKGDSCACFLTIT